MEIELITNMKKAPVEVVLDGLNSEDAHIGNAAYSRILREAQSFGLPLKKYLEAKVETGDSQLSGFETALHFMNLPVREDIKNHLNLQCATEVFQTQPGSRLLFPEVVLDMVKWKTPQDQIVTVEPLIAQSRTVASANQIIYNTELEGTEADSFNMFQLAEGGEIPIRKINATNTSVKFFKVGQGYEFTYEFQRRVALDILTPYINRVNRQFEIDKVRYATSILVNGDGVASGITVDNETTYGGVNGTLDWKSLFKWLVDRAAAGYPVDVLVGNYATYGDFMAMFMPTTGNTGIPQAMNAIGAPNLIPGLSFMNGSIAFAISNTVAATTLLGITKGETLEELVEANSDIVENDRNIVNQKIRFVRTLNIGYNLVTPSARRGFSYAS